MTQNGKNEDEIDVIALINRFLLLLKRNGLLLILFFIGGIILGLSFYFKSKPLYQLSLTCETDYGIGELMTHSIEKITSQVEIKNTHIVASKLNIDQEQAARLKLLKATLLDSKKDIGNYSSAVFNIHAEVFDTTEISVITDAILTYLKKNPLVEKRLSDQYNKALILKKTVDEETQEVDSLRSINTGYSKSLGSINESAIHLQEKQIEINHYLLVHSNFEKGLKFEKPIMLEQPSLIKKLITGVLAGLLIGIALILVKEFIKGLRSAH